jgi:hypothetical protein
MQLYKITEQYHQALSVLTDSDLDAQTISDTLEGLKGDIEVKAKNVAAFISNRKAEINAVKEASKKLADRAKFEQSSLDRLTEYLKYNMELAGITEIRSPELLLKIKTNPPSVIIDDESVIPKCFFTEKTVISINKTAIKEDLKCGNTVQGAHIEQKTRLEIK